MKLSPTFTTITPLSKFLALFFFILFNVLGFCFGRYYQRTEEIRQYLRSYKVDFIQNQQTSEVDSADDISNWKTYTHSLLSFSHPSDWVPQENPEYPGGNNVSFFVLGTIPDHSYGDHIGNEVFTFTIEPETRTLMQIKDEYYSDAALEKISNKDAFKTSFGLYYAKINDQQIISLVTGKTSPDIADQILSTFKFADEQIQGENYE